MTEHTISTSSRIPLRVLLAGLAVLILLFISSSAAAMAADSAVPIAQEETPGSGGQAQLPTATITPLGGPTQTPTRTPTLIPVQARLIGDPTNIRSGPGIDFDIVAELEQDTVLPIVGRWLGFDWLQVLYEDDIAWVYLPLVIVEGDITTVPAVEPPPAPTPDPTQVAAEATATILVQTPGAVESATAASFGIPTGVFTTEPENLSGQVGEQVSFPTFTPPGPLGQSANIAPINGEAALEGDTESSIIPPIVLIITLIGMGLLMVLLGLLRRLL